MWSPWKSSNTSFCCFYSLMLLSWALVGGPLGWKLDCREVWGLWRFLRSSWFSLVHHLRNLWPEASVFRSGGYNSEVEIQWSRRQWPYQESELAVPRSLASSLTPRLCTLMHLPCSDPVKGSFPRGALFILDFPASRAQGHINFWSL